MKWVVVERLRIDNKSTMVQIMAWCHQTSSHNPVHCWPKSVSPYGITTPQWLNTWIDDLYDTRACHTSGPYWDCHIRGTSISLQWRHNAWVRWRLNSPASRLFTQPFIQAQIKGQWRGALMFSLTCTSINGWVNNRVADDLRRHRAHYDVTEL